MCKYYLTSLEVILIAGAWAYRLILSNCLGLTLCSRTLVVPPLIATGYRKRKQTPVILSMEEKKHYGTARGAFMLHNRGAKGLGIFFHPHLFLSRNSSADKRKSMLCKSERIFLVTVVWIISIIWQKKKLGRSGQGYQVKSATRMQVHRVRLYPTRMEHCWHSLMNRRRCHNAWARPLSFIRTNHVLCGGTIETK